jgi:hypothetical protein
MNTKLPFLISINRLFHDTPEQFERDYGGELLVYSIESVDVEDWFRRFRQILLDAVGKTYKPIYRMADGEYQFLMGKKYNPYSPRRIRYFFSYLLHKTKELLTGASVKTSWGEMYHGEALVKLRRKYIQELNDLLSCGILCAYFYENPKNSFVHYNKYFLNFFQKNNLTLNQNNLFPFHFPFFALSNNGWQDFIVNRRILIITGNLENKKGDLEKNLKELGSAKVGFIEISPNSSMTDVISLKDKEYMSEYEIAFVAAGIGSLNIISQMKCFKGPVIDVGGFLSAVVNKEFQYHGGAVKFPV